VLPASRSSVAAYLRYSPTLELSFARSVACARKPRDNPSPQRWWCWPGGPVKATFVRPFPALPWTSAI